MFSDKTEQLLILVQLAIICQVSSDQIRCDAGVYSTGEHAAIVCHFPEKGTFKEKGFVVYEYTNNPTGRAIVLCASRNVSTCQIQEQGYTLEHFTNEQLKLKIPHVNKTFEGRYKCHLTADKDLESCDCILTVKDCLAPQTPTGNETCPSSQNTSSDLNILLTFFIPIGLLIIPVVSVGCVRRWYRNRHGQLKPFCMQSLLGNQEDHHEDLDLEQFMLTKKDLVRIMGLLDRQMNIRSGNDKKKSICMYSTSLRSLPTGTEKGTFLVVELGSTHLIVHLVKLTKDNPDAQEEPTKIPLDIKHGSAKELFAFIATHIKHFLRNMGKAAPKKLQVAFVSPFPCDQDGYPDKTCVTKLTNEFHCDGIIGKDLKWMIQKALNNKGLSRLMVTVIVNTAACTFMAGYYKDKRCKAACVLGNGFSACFIKDQSPTETSDRDLRLVMNADWGGFGNGGHLDLLKAKEDIELDKYSVKPGKQIFEKMVTKIYLGEIVRRKLYDDDEVFAVDDHSTLSKRFRLTPDYISSIQSDHDGCFSNTKRVLQKLGVKLPTDEQCLHAQTVCRAVVLRASHLTAAALAVIINRCVAPEAVVAITGSTTSEDDFFLEQVKAMTQELIQPNRNIEILPVQKGTAIGAAVIAAISETFADS